MRMNKIGRMKVLLAVLALASTRLPAQEYKANLPLDHPAIQYFQDPVHDPVSRLTDAPQSLEALLKQLGINTDSQMLVFSKTSFQAPKIAPDNPRAIYFNDEVAVGFVRGSENIEVASLDPVLGPIFYELGKDKATGSLKFERQAVCLNCHQGPNTSGVAGIYIGSVIPGPSGAPLRDESAIITDHRTEFKDRWGGWYVNAKSGEQRDRANAVALNPSAPDMLVRDSQQNLLNLMGKFNPSSYLNAISDIVALMTFEHQTQMVNYFTRAGWESRVGGEPEIEELIGYMLFDKEAPLVEPIEGVSTFSKTFPQRGPRDKKGRSLRDFDLKTRIFKYPFSYMIYSPSFNAIPAPVRERIYRRLYDILKGADYPHLSSADRIALLEILRDTKTDLPEYWVRP